MKETAIKPIDLHWHPRTEPLTPTAVAAWNPAARRLAAKLLNQDGDAMAQLRGTAGRDVIVLIGSSEDLPWIDGGCYFGIDPEAPSLLVPTHSKPAISIRLIEKAIPRPHGAEQCLLSPHHGCIIPIGSARPLERSRLHRWLEENSQ